MSPFINARGVFSEIRAIAKSIRRSAKEEGHEWVTIRHAVDMAVDGFGEHHNIWLHRRRKS